MLGDIIFNGQQAVRYGLVEAILLRSLSTWLEQRQGDENCYVKDTAMSRRCNDILDCKRLWLERPKAERVPSSKRRTV